MNTRDLVTDEDLMGSLAAGARHETGEDATAVVDELAGLSARERARLKRKAKQTEKAEREGPRQKRQKDEDAGGEAGPDAKWPWSFEDHQEAIGAGAWPLQPLVDELCVDLLHSRWEIRHGAAAALREMLMSGAARAGVEIPSPDPDTPFFLQGSGVTFDLTHVTPEAAGAALETHHAWLEDCVLRCVCVLALDRFGDYVGDRVVGPVRETTAQALGTCCSVLPESILTPVLGLIRTLGLRPEWEVRHGAQLGLQYLLASRSDLSAVCGLSRVLDVVHAGLADTEDDNAAVAADSIVAVLADLATNADAYALVRSSLLAKLSALEDLSPTAGAILATLAEMYGRLGSAAPSSLKQEGDAPSLPAELAAVVPRALPFLFHSLRTVRRNTATCLLRILEATPAPLSWLTPAMLLDLLHCTWTNLLVETDADVATCSHAIFCTAAERAVPDTLEAALSKGGLLTGMLALAASPHGAVLDPNLLPRWIFSTPKGAPIAVQHRSYEVGADVANLSASGMRMRAARALGRLLRCAPPALRSAIQAELAAMFNRCSQGSRLFAALTIHSALTAEPNTAFALDPTLDRAIRTLLSAPSASAPSPSNPEQCYEEVLSAYARLSHEVGGLANHCRAINLALPVPPPNASGRLPTDAVAQIITDLVVPPGGRPQELAAAARERVLSTCATLKFIEQAHHTAVTAALAAALVATGQLPDKVTHVIQPLMASLKGDLEFPLQELSAAALAHVLELCAGRSPCPNPKVLQNLLKLVLGDRSRVPDATQPDPGDAGGPALLARDDTLGGLELSPPEVARRGGDAALRAVARRFQTALPTTLPDLWRFATETLVSAPALAAADPVVLVESLAVLRALCPAMNPAALHELLLPLLPRVCHVLRHPNWAARRSATLLLAAAAVAHTDTLLPRLLKIVLPMVGDTADDGARSEAVRLLNDLTEALGPRLVPYVVLLLLPLMARMSDAVQGTRLMAARAFGALVPLLALAQGAGASALPAGLDAEQRTQAEADAAFLAQLLDSKCAEEFPLPVPLKCDLRPYQKEGINWLAFLRKFGLHGVLADDMVRSAVH